MRARLDQHFLIDESVRDQMIAAARLGVGDIVVEIGPGKGMLTESLLSRAARVIAVEKDCRLVENLNRRFAERPNFRLIGADFLQLDLSELGEGPVKFVANLPYSVANPILGRILSWPRWSLALLMFQKEVAERIVAKPGSRDYGILTLSGLTRARSEIVMEVAGRSFSPPPKVISAVVEMIPIPSPFAYPQEEGRFFKLAKSAFSQRRKMAAGPISRALGFPHGRVVQALESCGLKGTCRAEEIPFEAYLKLSRDLIKLGPEGKFPP